LLGVGLRRLARCSLALCRQQGRQLGQQLGADRGLGGVGGGGCGLAGDGNAFDAAVGLLLDDVLPRGATGCAGAVGLVLGAVLAEGALVDAQLGEVVELAGLARAFAAVGAHRAVEVDFFALLQVRRHRGGVRSPEDEAEAVRFLGLVAVDDDAAGEADGRVLTLAGRLGEDAFAGDSSDEGTTVDVHVLSFFTLMFEVRQNPHLVPFLNKLLSQEVQIFAVWLLGLRGKFVSLNDDVFALDEALEDESFVGDVDGGAGKLGGLGVDVEFVDGQEGFLLVTGKDRDGRFVAACGQRDCDAVVGEVQRRHAREAVEQVLELFLVDVDDDGRVVVDDVGGET